MGEMPLEVERLLYWTLMLNDMCLNDVLQAFWWSLHFICQGFMCYSEYFDKMSGDNADYLARIGSYNSNIIIIDCLTNTYPLSNNESGTLQSVTVYIVPL